MPDTVPAPVTTAIHRVAGPPPLLRWTGFCAAAEAIGMAASAAAARIADTVVGGAPTTSVALIALAIIVAGGLVEGVALGVAQAAGLAAWLTGRRGRWILVTVLVAGLGWAAASAPAVLSDDADGAEPALVTVLAATAGLGLVMGAALGAAQALVLRGRVPHPWRWTVGSALGWTVAMPVVFLGAGLTGAQWPLVAVVAAGAVTGLAAGGAFGLLSGSVLPAVVGASVPATVKG
jgi:hypothetical protein